MLARPIQWSRCLASHHNHVRRHRVQHADQTLRACSCSIGQWEEASSQNEPAPALVNMTTATDADAEPPVPPPGIIHAFDRQQHGDGGTRCTDIERDVPKARCRRGSRAVYPPMLAKIVPVEGRHKRASDLNLQKLSCNRLGSFEVAISGSASS